METVEDMDVDDTTYNNVKNDLKYLDHEDKENKPFVNKLLPHDYSCGDLDQSEIDMKLRLSCTPHKHNTYLFDAGDVNKSVTPALNQTMDMSICDETIIENVDNKNVTLEIQNETATLETMNDSVPVLTVENEPPKPTSSPIFRGLQSVLNMFRPSQSPINLLNTASSTPNNDLNSKDDTLEQSQSADDSAIIFNFDKLKEKQNNLKVSNENLNCYSSNDSLNDKFEECIPDNQDVSTKLSKDLSMVSSHFESPVQSNVIATNDTFNVETQLPNDSFDCKEDILLSDINQLQNEDVNNKFCHAEKDKIKETEQNVTSNICKSIKLPDDSFDVMVDPNAENHDTNNSKFETETNEPNNALSCMNSTQIISSVKKLSETQNISTDSTEPELQQTYTITQSPKESFVQEDSNENDSKSIGDTQKDSLDHTEIDSSNENQHKPSIDFTEDKVGNETNFKHIDKNNTFSYMNSTQVLSSVFNDTENIMSTVTDSPKTEMQQTFLISQFSQDRNTSCSNPTYNECVQIMHDVSNIQQPKDSLDPQDIAIEDSQQVLKSKSRDTFVIQPEADTVNISLDISQINKNNINSNTKEQQKEIIETTNAILLETSENIVNNLTFDLQPNSIEALNVNETQPISYDSKELSSTTQNGSFYFSAENSEVTENTTDIENITENIVSKIDDSTVNVEINPSIGNYNSTNDVTLTEDSNLNNANVLSPKDEVHKSLFELQKKIENFGCALATEEANLDNIYSSKFDDFVEPASASIAKTENNLKGKVYSDNNVESYNLSFEAAPSGMLDLLDDENDLKMEKEAFGNLVIDSNTFDQLMNKDGKPAIETGKESLFQKFDPLWRQSIYGGKQSSDEMISFDNSPIGKIEKRPDILRSTQEQLPENPATTEQSLQTPGAVTTSSYSVEKPIMAVCPAPNSSQKVYLSPAQSSRQSTTYSSSAFAVTEQLISLVCTPPTLRKQTVNYEEMQEKIQEIRTMLQEKENENAELARETLNLKGKLAEKEMRTQELEELSKKHEQQLKKLEELTNNEKEMKKVFEEFEKTISALIAEKEEQKRVHEQEMNKLISERDDQTFHLKGMVFSYNALLAKYDQIKSILKEHADDQKKYLETIEQHENIRKKLEDMYEQVKEHANRKLNEANVELAKMKHAHDGEITKLKAMIRKKDFEAASLVETLSQKDKDYKQLSSICDELLAKVSEK